MGRRGRFCWSPGPAADVSFCPIRPPQSTVWRVGGEIGGEFRLPTVAVGEQLFLIVEQFLARLGGELEVRPLDDRIDRAGLLAIAAVDALHHVDVVAGRPPAAIFARLRLDGDRQRRTDRLAQLTGDAALLAVRITPERMLAAEAGAERTFLVWIVQRHLRPEHVPEGERQTGHQLAEKNGPGGAIHKAHAATSQRVPAGSQSNATSTPETTATASSDNGRNTFQPSRINWS